MTTDTLSRKDNELVARYYDDSLRKEANVFTLESRNGRLHGPHGEVLDTGGSTGGYVRGILQIGKNPIRRHSRSIAASVVTSSVVK